MFSALSFVQRLYSGIYLLIFATLFNFAQTQFCYNNLTVANGSFSYSDIFTGSVATLSCDAGFEINGNNQATCSPPNWSAIGTCDAIQNFCPVPANVTSGLVTYNSTALNAVANIVCDTGYIINGAPTITCQADFSWSLAGVCDPVDCQNKLVVVNGVVTYSQGTRFPANATVTCNTDYVLKGSDVVQCLPSGNWDTPPTCLRDCGTLPSISFGNLNLTGNATTENETANVFCDTGYMPNVTQITCEASGNWQTVLCTLIDCGNVSVIDFGNITLTDSNNSTYGASATVVCQSGFEASNSTILCLESGVWQNATCAPKDCGVVPIINFGIASLAVPSNTTYGASASVSCDAGFETNTTIILCLASGSWENASCTAKDCGNVSVIDFGNITITDSNNSTYGASATVVCQSGFEASNSTILCLESGVWQNATCAAKDCGVVPIINFGIVSLTDQSNTTYGASALVSCDAGFETNTPTILCQASGSWENTSCTAKNCGNVSVIDFGNITLTDSNNSTYGASATVVCQSGFEASNSTILCLESGVWQNTTCVVKDCGVVPIINFGNVNLTDPSNTTYGASASVSCDAGFETNTTIILCLASGSWENATCTAKDCGVVPIITFGNVSLADPSNTTYGASASVTCDAGFETNTASILCLASGSWENTSCTAKDCGNVAIIDFGNITVTDTSNSTYGASATVVCQSGFEASNSTILCLESGVWQNATCAAKDCGVVPIINFGNVSLTDQSNSTYGASASVSCDAGFETNTPTILCLASGSWENASCTAKDCGNVSVIDFGNITLTDTSNSTYGASASVVCQSGFEASNSTILCLESGMWQNATCAAKDCGVVPIINYGNVSLTDHSNTTYGASASFSCDAGFESNTSTILCLASGSWENATCTAKDCGYVSVIDFGNITLTDPNNSTYGASATVVCQSGFEASNSTILCLESGVWQNATCVAKDCGVVPIITFGNVSLADPSNTTYGASASVTCDTGFETNTSSILCLASGSWENTSCTAKDCGVVPIINFGNVSLTDPSNTTYGASASVSCDAGFQTNTTTILCLASGSWENTSCTAKDCGNVPIIDNGNVTLKDPQNSTYGSSATVLCNTGYETLVPDIFCESNGSWSNTTCFLKDCHDPTPDHGTVDTTSGFKVNSLALVTCDIGYKVSGSRIITCQFGGTWTVNSTCAPIECGNLTIAKGVFEAANGTSYLQTATVTCNSGYTLTGDATVVCEDNGRWSDTPSCDPSDCKDPTPVHGVSSFTMTTFGGQANITCNEGYDIKGLSSITCLDNATWSDSTVCIAKDCGTLAITNGNVVLASGTTTYTSLALVSCSTGYVIQGTAFLLCQGNGSWSDSPSCKPVDCRDPTPKNGFTDNNATTFGTAVTVTCLPGYEISGNSSITCLSSGFWSSYPACIAKDCGDPTPNNGKAVASSGTTYPNNATISCSYGYNLVGSATISCQSNGTWSDSPYCNLKALGDSCLVKRDCTEFDDNSVCDTGHTNTCICANGYINTSNVCTIVDCGMPSLPNGLSTSPLGTTYGEITIVSCDTGFILNGSAYITCLSNGTWSTAPTCNIVDCGDPTPLNAHSNFTSNTTYQSLASIICDAGYAISGSSNIICQKDGQWSSYPSCKLVDCGNPAPLNGYSGSSGTSFRDNVTIFCEPGYTLNGSNTITCQMNGTWTDRPVCNINDCGDPSPSNGLAVAPRGTTFGESALITCDTGFAANGTIFVTCLANGTWSSLPTCQLKDCGDPTPASGGVNTSETTYGTVVNVTCDTGFVLSGAAVIKCQTDGSWSGSPTCAAKECGSPQLTHGLATTTGSTTFGANATLSCNAGFNLNGDMLFTCTETGWSGNATCVIKDCGNISISGGTASTPKGTTYGEVAIISCKDGYTLNGTSFITCQADGIWSTLPTCDIKDCGNPTPTDGIVNATTTTYGSVVNVSCIKGFSLIGDAVITCKADGSWSGKPTCSAKDCGSPIPTNGVAATIGGTAYGANATLGCRVGYNLTSDTFVTCTETGWSGNASCEIHDCGRPSIPGGTASFPKGTTYGELAIISCNDGYTLNGSSFITCQANATWSTLPTCVIKDCGDPKPVSGSLNSTVTTYGSVVRVTCDTGFNLTGAAVIKCKADGTWSGNPTCSAADCGSPRPSNGLATTTGGTSFGANATLSCNSGYDLFGDTSVTCNETGWSGNATCIIKDCLSPSVSGGTSSTPKGTTYGEVALISCQDGYTLNGTSLVTCQTDGNWSTLPTCVIKDCGDPTPTSGIVNSSNTTYGSVVNVSCITGFDLSGPAVIICKADSLWSGSPKCLAQDCGSPQPSNGLASTPGGTIYGATATLSCSAGYELVGNSSVNCTATGWSGNATCKINDCGSPNLSGGTTSTPRGTTYGEFAIISCNDGYTLNGTGLITCQANGTWSTLPTCEIKDCSSPPLSHGVFNSTNTTYGSVLSVTCDNGYVPNGASVIQCKADGSWSATATCSAKDCGSPKPLNGLATIVGGTTYGANATLSCNAGYYLVGALLVTCNETGWSGNTTCVIKDCGSPSPFNGTANAPKGTTYGEVAIISCDDGYTSNGTAFITCQANGTWNTLPKCIIKDCGDPTPASGKTNSNATTYGSVVSISCDKGFSLQGDAVIKCKADGTWSGSPTCSATDCGSPRPSNGFASLTGGTTYGANATLSCNTGYNLIGDSFVTCNETGWSGNASCEIKDCESPTPQGGTSITPKGTTYGEVAIISCNGGYTLNGTSFITCEANGNWSSLPTCIIKDCGDPKPASGSVNSTQRTYGSVVNVTCDTGFYLSGSGVIECKADGTWSGNPACIAKNCGDIRPVNGYAITSGATTFGANATLSCTSGYILTGDSFVTCTETGWSGNATCMIKDCGSPTPQGGTASTPKGTTYGEVAIITCNNGYTLNGTSFITCQADGNWSTLPSCIIKDCGDPTPALGSVNTTNTTYGTKALVTCDSGYDLNGPKVIECRADGFWSASPTCSPTDCGSPQPLNGFATTTGGSTIGANATLSCSTGYNLTGETFVTCTVTGWSGNATCVLRECGSPSVSGGTVTTPKGTTYGEVAFVTCDDGYTLNGSSFIACQANSSWSTLPTCGVKDCGSPEPLSGNVNSSATTYGSVVKVTCASGYDLKGSDIIECRADGTWSETPTCSARDCGSPRPINGLATNTGGTTFGANSTLSCNQGYNLTGETIVTCTEMGWSGNATCAINDCGNPSPSSGTASTPKGTTYGEVAIVTCEDGYTLNGTPFISCLANGSWSALPECVIKDCGNPQPVSGNVNSTSTTYGSVISVTCDTGYVLSGTAVITCKADGSWSGSPTCLAKECGTPLLVNGLAAIINGTTYQSIATLSCNAGYNLVGDMFMTCTETGWSGNTTCVIKDCTSPAPANGTASTPKGTTYGEVAIITCNDGYALNGTSFITCQASGNWSTLPTCQIKDCGDPTPSSGSVNSTETTYGSVVGVNCSSGLNIIGANVITCRADGTWSGGPTCSPSDCGSPKPVNGLVTTTGGTTLGANATLSCNVGYDLTGDEFVTCNATGWSGNATCVIKDCGSPSPQGGTANTPKGTTYGEVAIISCNDGYTLNGTSFITCQANGNWSTSPICVIKDCGNSTPTAGSVNTTDSTYGTVVKVSCNVGFVLSGAEIITCQADGKWSASPTCIAKDCGSPTPINGIATTNGGTSYGAQATLSCMVGYNLNGSSNITCLETGWSGNATCVIQDCNDPSPSNGSAITPKGTTYGEFAIVFCEDGYTLNGTSFITCQANGIWSALPTCRIKDCGDPKPTSGSVNSTATTFGSVVNITCDTGFELSGHSVIECQADGSWNGVPSCSAKDCGSPRPLNGFAATTGGTKFGATANLSCSTGYQLQGDTLITCTETGWSANSTCVIQDCGSISLSGGTASTPKGTTFGEVAVITCEEGYTLNGTSFISCQANGNWSALPKCVIKDCGDPTPSWGTVNSTDTTFGTVVSVSCITGFDLGGSAVIKCKADGVWSGIPICSARDCGSPRPSNGLAVLTGGTAYGANATLSCNAGYNLIGDTSVNCTETGWSGNASCVVKDCGNPSPLGGTASTPRGTTYGEVAIISCEKGYTLNGTSFIICQANGNWSAFPTCVITDCGDPKPTLGIANSTVTTYGSVVSISCASGYSLSGPAVIECRADGLWSGNPTCSATDCGIARLSNGVVNITGGTSSGANATLSCNSGYNLVGDTYLICNESGWFGNATCLIKDCGSISLSDGTASTPKGTTYGEAAFISCKDGYSLNGTAFITCLASGYWSALPTCVIKDCGNPSPVSGSVNSTNTTYGTVVGVICDMGYRVSGNMAITCKADGTWSGSLTCTAIDCGNPVPSNGIATLSGGTTFGANATLSCKEGYDIIGQSFVTCNQTGWSGNATCKIRDCGGISLAGVVASTPAGTTYGDFAIVTCEDGFTLNGTSFIICQANGTWSTVPTCDIQDCGDPTPSSGAVNSTSTVYGSVVHVTCKAGFVISVADVIKCRADGTWSASPVCSLKDCGSPKPSNGLAVTVGGTTYRSNATLSCNVGYNLSGDTFVNCTETGWSGNATCLIRDCGSPFVSDGATFIPKGTTYGELAIISCNDGYSLNGTSFIACQENGTWSTLPTCVIKDCGDPKPVSGDVNSTATTYGSIISITCNTGYVLSGTAVIKCQADGKWSGSAVCAAIDCGNPRPTSGLATTTGGTTFGANATLSCSAGYNLVGSSFVTCNETGWSGNATCVIKDCGNVFVSGGTASTPKGTSYGEVAIISCQDGYTLNGTSFITCQADGIWSAFPKCVIKDCGDPKPTSGSVNSSQTTYASVVSVTCDKGFTLNGAAVITCKADGTWSGVPTCALIDCGIPQFLNGVATTSGVTTFGANATLSCSAGYDLVGNPSMICNETGWWSNASCRIKDCGSTFPPEVVTSAPKGTTYGEVAIISCKDGYTLNGTNFITCQADGNWGAFPTCMIKDCGDPKPASGSVNSTSTTYGSVVKVSCVTGYDISGASVIECRADSTWSANPTCIAKDCGSPSPSGGSATTFGGTSYGANATLGCSTGYVLSGSTFVTCTDSGWSGNATCQIRDCGSIPPLDGTASTPKGTTYGEVAIVSCNDGYTLNGTSFITCQANGSWSTLPTCVIKDCGDPTPVSGSVNSTVTTYGSVVRISCNPGFAVSGPAVIKCQADGRWSGNPICSATECGDPAPRNGYIVNSTGTTFGSTTTVSCNNGYTLNGSSTFNCTQIGWNSVASCNIKDCGSPSLPFGTAATPGGTVYGQYALVTCNDGYQLTGSPSLVCQSTGNWSSYPTCVAVDCGSPSVSNGVVVFSGGTFYTSKANVTCNSGYILTGNSSITCDQTGTWSTGTSCIPIDCGDPTPVNGIAYGYTTFSSDAIITCIKGYEINGTNKITCQAGGSWSENSTCNPIDCGAPTVLHAMVSTPTGTTYTQTGSVTCLSGYSLTGGIQIECMADGIWSTGPVCIPIDCGDPLVANSVSFGDTFYAGNSIISCNDGYKLNGNSIITCTENGTWTVKPTCDSVDCGSVAVTNGMVNASSGTKYNQTASVTCNAGYVLKGSSSVITCLASGVWSTLPTCEPSGCDDPSPLNGYAKISGNVVVGITATIVCNTGYIYNGTSNIVTCLANGSWTQYPTCDPIDCGPLTDPENGKIELSGGTTYGSSAYISCTDGYTVSGDTTRICLSKGKWSGVNSTCTKDEAYDFLKTNAFVIIAAVIGAIGLIDVIIIAVCVYFKYCKKKPDQPEPCETSDNEEEEEEKLPPKPDRKPFPFDSPRGLLPPVLWGHPPPETPKPPLRTLQYSPRDDLRNKGKSPKQKTPVANGFQNGGPSKPSIQPIPKVTGGPPDKKYSVNLNDKTKQDFKLERDHQTPLVRRAEYNANRQFRKTESDRERLARELETRQLSISPYMFENVPDDDKRQEKTIPSNKIRGDLSPHPTEESHDSVQDINLTIDDETHSNDMKISTNQIKFKIEANSSNPPSVSISRRHLTSVGLGSTENLHEDSRSRSSSVSQSRSRSDSVSSVMQNSSDLPSVEMVSPRQLLPISPAQLSDSENHYDFADGDKDDFYDRSVPQATQTPNSLDRSPEVAYMQFENASVDPQGDHNMSGSVHVSDISSIAMGQTARQRAEYVTSPPTTPSTSGAILHRKRPGREHMGETDSDKEAKRKDQERRKRIV